VSSLILAELHMLTETDMHVMEMDAVHCVCINSFFNERIAPVLASVLSVTELPR